MLEILTGIVALGIAVSAVGKALNLRGGSSTTSTAGSADTFTVYAETGYNNADNRYVFTLKRLPSGYRCYIDRTPSYRGRSVSMHIAHYLTDSRGKYICYTKDLAHIEQARTLCRQWSNLTQRYIETGRTFES